jgi:hypothetical protein
MKSVQIVAHTTGGEVRGAVDQMTERDYEALKTEIKNSAYLEFNTDNGWVLIPGPSILYVEVQIY